MVWNLFLSRETQQEKSDKAVRRNNRAEDAMKRQRETKTTTGNNKNDSTRTKTDRRRVFI